MFSNGTVAGPASFLCNGLDAPEPPAGTLLFLEAGSAAPDGYVLLGTYRVTPTATSPGQPLQVAIYRKE